MACCEKGYIDVVKLLLSSPKLKINLTDSKGHTAMVIAYQQSKSNEKTYILK
eukprot:UN29373